MNPEKWRELNARVIALHQQGWYSRAAELAQKTLEVARLTFGGEHPNLAESMKNLGLIYYSQGKASEAALFELASGRRRGKDLWSDQEEFTQSLNRLILLNLARRKYAEAETLFKQALALKEKALGPGHPEIAQCLGNLAEVYNSQGKYAEAESIFHSLRSRIRAMTGNNGLSARKRTPDLIETDYPREHIRFGGQFPVELSGKGSDFSAPGVTANLGQGGAFIKTRHWRSFKINEQVAVTIVLPSVFSEENIKVGIQGTAVITRIDEQSEGVAVKFTKDLRKFENIGEVETPGEIRYKRVAAYLPSLGEVKLAEFETNHPYGIFLERFQTILDRKVMFQFETITQPHSQVRNQLEKTTLEAEVLDARIIEIKKRKSNGLPTIITIGRSPSNDIVLYNKMISKAHACLYVASPGKVIYLVDLGSTNCTFLNDEKLAPCKMYRLGDADEIALGPQARLVYLSAKAFYDFLTAVASLHC